MSEDSLCEGWSEDRKWIEGEKTEITYTEGEEGQCTLMHSLLLMRQQRISDKEKVSLSHTCPHTHTDTHTSDCFGSVYWGRSSPEAQGQKHSQQSIPLCLPLSSWVFLGNPASCCRVLMMSLCLHVCVIVRVCVGDSSEMPPQPELCVLAADTKRQCLKTSILCTHTHTGLIRVLVRPQYHTLP